MRLLTFHELKDKKGVPYTREHLRRKIKDGTFPEPVRHSAKRIGWVEAEIDAYNERLLAERDARAAAKRPPVSCGAGDPA